MQRRSVQWLAKKLYCDRSNIYRLFQKESLDASLILRISRILHRDFFELYSNELKTDNASNGDAAEVE